MSGVFSLVGGAADPIAIKLTTTNATKIAEAVTGGARVSIPWLKFTEIAGATPTLGYYILKPDTTIVYHRNAKAMAAKEEVTNELGIVLLPGWPQSKGVALEIAVALACTKRVFVIVNGGLFEITKPTDGFTDLTAGKRLPAVFHVGARALTSQALNIHAGHDDVMAVADTGWGILFARNVQEAADLAAIARRVSEATEVPFFVVQDGFHPTPTTEPRRSRNGGECRTC